MIKKNFDNFHSPKNFFLYNKIKKNKGINVVRSVDNVNEIIVNLIGKFMDDFRIVE